MAFCKFVLARQQVLNSLLLEEFCIVIYQLVHLALDDSGFVYFNHFAFDTSEPLLLHSVCLYPFSMLPFFFLLCYYSFVLYPFSA